MSFGPALGAALAEFVETGLIYAVGPAGEIKAMTFEAWSALPATDRQGWRFRISQKSAIALSSKRAQQHANRS